MNIIELFRDRALIQPHFPAIIDRDPRTRFGHSRITSFSDLEFFSQCWARFLHQKGLKPGDGVLIFYPLSAELYIILAAVFRLGLVAIFLDPAAGRKHIDRCCQIYPPQVFISNTKAHFLQLFCPQLQQIPLKISLGCPFLQTLSRQKISGLVPYTEIYPCLPDSPALLTFTSGSTGQPKAVMRSQGFLIAQYQILRQTLQLQPGELELSTLPIFIFANLASGLTSLIPDVDLRFPGKIKADRAIAQIKKYHPSRLIASPAFLECLIDWCRDRSLILPQIEKIFVGGAPVMPHTISQLKNVFPQAKITIVYGSTEAEPIASIAEEEIAELDWQKMRSGGGLLVGKPVSDLQLQLFSEPEKAIAFSQENEFKNYCLPWGEVGEIIVSGDRVLSGYLNEKEEKTNKIRVGGTLWHSTGDLGYLDEWGRLWLLGRRSGCIRDRFGILYPFAVECVINCCPEVKRSAVISWQGKRILLIELRKNKQQLDLKFWQHFLENNRIARIKICSQIPVDKRHNSKVDYTRVYDIMPKLMGEER
ncbi:AMP-binding protein [Spirulina sp. 06S082]|uniref:AMP-binding protein n=1 Tax=Spirulina sp. 06S082 TaxID=3110248 RepID=UPI002B1F1BAD|nr:AMP-binding protein [Spirulina sp. 06S082]MEA5468570.1 AMP-binding protein [Spirulina sp. 06S082]